MGCRFRSSCIGWYVCFLSLGVRGWGLFANLHSRISRTHPTSLTGMRSRRLEMLVSCLPRRRRGCLLVIVRQCSGASSHVPHRRGNKSKLMQPADPASHINSWLLSHPCPSFCTFRVLSRKEHKKAHKSGCHNDEKIDKDQQEQEVSNIEFSSSSSTRHLSKFSLGKSWHRLQTRSQTLGQTLGQVRKRLPSSSSTLPLPLPSNGPRGLQTPCTASTCLFTADTREHSSSSEHSADISRSWSWSAMQPSRKSLCFVHCANESMIAP